MLIHLLSDFIKDPDLRQRYQKEARAVLMDYQVPPNVIRILESGDRAQLADRLFKEFEDANEGRTPLYFPLPVLSVTKCTPDNGTTNTSINFVIGGDGFTDNCTVTFNHPAHTVTATVDSTTKDTINATATFNDKGVYDLTVADTISGAHDALASAFTCS